MLTSPCNSLRSRPHAVARGREAVTTCTAFCARLLAFVVLALAPVSPGFAYAGPAFGSSGDGVGHPYHESYAEIEVGPGGADLEVALRADALEIQNALRARRDEIYELETPGVELALQRYLVETFLAKDDAAGWGTLEWVGHELEEQDLWCYFRLRFDGPVRSFSISHSVLFERNRYQRNLVQLLGPTASEARSFERGTPWARFTPAVSELRSGWSMKPYALPGTDRWWAARGEDWRVVLSGATSTGASFTDPSQR